MRFNFDPNRMDQFTLLRATRVPLLVERQPEHLILRRQGVLPPLVALFTPTSDTECTITNVVQSGPADQYTIEKMTDMKRSLMQLLTQYSSFGFDADEYRALMSIAIICGVRQGFQFPPYARPSTLYMVYTTPLSVDSTSDTDCTVRFLVDNTNDTHQLLLRRYTRTYPTTRIVSWHKRPPTMDTGLIMLPVVSAVLEGVYVPENNYGIDHCYMALTGNKDRYSPREIPLFTAQRMYVIFVILSKCCNENTDLFRRNIGRFRKLLNPSSNTSAMAALCAMDPLASAQALRVLQQAQMAISGQTALRSTSGFVPPSVENNYSGLWKNAEMRVTNSQIRLMQRYMEGSLSLRALRL